MSYIEKSLLANEQILYRAKLHWFIFVAPAIWTIAAIFFYFHYYEMPIFSLVCTIMAVGYWLSAFISYTCSEFGITNKRVILKIGFIRRNTLELFLHKIESIQVDQTILGRIFNFGSIIISGTGGSKDPFYLIADPLIFRRKIQEQIDISRSNTI